MSLIDKTYFSLDHAIPESDYSTITAHITKYEPEILKKALGYTLYKLMIDNAADEPYKSLIEGKEYEIQYDGQTHKVKWNGLKNEDKNSLIAYYVYYWWQRNQASLTIYTGEIKPMHENATNASLMQKISNAWTRLLELYGYPEQDRLQPSLYNYLLENESDFPSWIFTELGSVNIFDL